MTDNEIKKVLECCSDGTGKGIIKATLDLIKRKDEQIEGLISGQETLQKALAEKIAEVETLNTDLVLQEIHCDNYFKENKQLKADNERLKKVQVQYVEAWIDEFVVRLKNDCLLATPNIGLINNVIDELVESMKSDFSCLANFTDLIKSEAVKEFADLVVKNIRENVTPIPQQRYLVNMCIQEIENTKKEMVGEGDTDAE